jgi:hypothetical protein
VYHACDRETRGVQMNLDQMIKELKGEAEALDAAIVVLQRLAVSQKRRRGRPPAWLQVGFDEAPPKALKTGRKRSLSEDTKKKMAEAQKKRWAAARKERHSS